MHHHHAADAPRRPALLAHGSVSRPLILSLLTACVLLGYGWFFVTTPTEQDAAVCQTWLQQYTERVDSAAIFEKAGCTYKDITATSHGIYATVEIRTDKPCPALPQPLDAYFTLNQLGLFMRVRLYAEGDEKPYLSRLY